MKIIVNIYKIKSNVKNIKKNHKGFAIIKIKNPKNIQIYYHSRCNKKYVF